MGLQPRSLGTKRMRGTAEAADAEAGFALAASPFRAALLAAAETTAETAPASESVWAKPTLCPAPSSLLLRHLLLWRRFELQGSFEEGWAPEQLLQMQLLALNRCGSFVSVEASVAQMKRRLLGSLGLSGSAGKPGEDAAAAAVVTVTDVAVSVAISPSASFAAAAVAVAVGVASACAFSVADGSAAASASAVASGRAFTGCWLPGRRHSVYKRQEAARSIVNQTLLRK